MSVCPMPAFRGCLWWLVCLSAASLGGLGLWVVLPCTLAIFSFFMQVGGGGGGLVVLCACCLVAFIPNV